MNQTIKICCGYHNYAALWAYIWKKKYNIHTREKPIRNTHTEPPQSKVHHKIGGVLVYGGRITVLKGFKLPPASVTDDLTSPLMYLTSTHVLIYDSPWLRDEFSH